MSERDRTDIACDNCGRKKIADEADWILWFGSDAICPECFRLNVEKLPADKVGVIDLDTGETVDE